jgi:iron-sulfur cluster assembly protein
MSSSERMQHSTMDYDESDIAEGFVFENPQAQGTCGCGESFF